MPERTFGRTVRYRRTKLGLSQAKLGELVGRSATTVRSWERDQTQPNDAAVLTALSAVLGVDERTMFEKAGQTIPEVETSPTMEQELATLRPSPGESSDSLLTEEDGDPVADVASTAGAEGDRDLAVETEEEPNRPTDEHKVDEPEEDGDSIAASNGSTSSAPGYVAPPAPYQTTTAFPPVYEPSYMEDRTQRQLYRVRNLATIVALVALGIALLWAMTESLGALGEWWDQFFGNLRL